MPIDFRIELSIAERDRIKGQDKRAADTFQGVDINPKAIVLGTVTEMLLYEILMEQRKQTRLLEFIADTNDSIRRSLT